VIHLEFDDFVSICQFTGAEDRGKIEITYIPDRELVNLKNLRGHLESFKGKKTLMEYVPNEILDYLTKEHEPLMAIVKATFDTKKAGMRITVSAEYTSDAYFKRKPP